MLEKQLWTFRRWRRERKLSALDNVPYNRDLWDSYAQAWSHPEFREGVRDVRELVAGHGNARALGEKWATPADLERVLGEFLLPYVSERSVVGEIGSGGGRIAAHVAGEVAELHCFDISSRMLERAKTTLWAKSNVTYTLLDGPSLPPEQTDHFDFLYSFDVFPHLDLHTMWKYVREIRRTLKPGGRALVQTANLTTPAGWERFSAQDEYSIEGHYFITPEVFRTLLDHAELEPVVESKPDPENFYLNRDYVVVLERPGPQKGQRARSTRGTRRRSGAASKSGPAKAAAPKRSTARRAAPKRRTTEPRAPEAPVVQPVASAERVTEASVREPTAPEADGTETPAPEPTTPDADATETPAPEPTAPDAEADADADATETAPDPDADATETPSPDQPWSEGVVSERPASKPGGSEPDDARSEAPPPRAVGHPASGPPRRED
jgi:SAM-dependent methyltransferase